MRGCELCRSRARMYCESDQASLCWDCDAKVHGANFLVARHARTLLCRVCQSPTPWTASGARLGPAVNVCVRCVDSSCGGRDKGGAAEEQSGAGLCNNDHDIDTGDEYDEEDESDDGAEEEEDVEIDADADDEEVDNQVVPWTCPPPPPSASSSSGEESSSRFYNSESGPSELPTKISLKRVRETASNLFFQEDHGRSYFHQEGEASSADSLRPSKDRRTELARPVQVQASSRSAVIFESLKRLHDHDVASGGEAYENEAVTYKLCDESGAVDLNCSNSPGRPI